MCKIIACGRPDNARKECMSMMRDDIRPPVKAPKVDVGVRATIAWKRVIHLSKQAPAEVKVGNDKIGK